MERKIAYTYYSEICEGNHLDRQPFSQNNSLNVAPNDATYKCYQTSKTTLLMYMQSSITSYKHKLILVTAISTSTNMICQSYSSYYLKFIKNNLPKKGNKKIIY